MAIETLSPTSDTQGTGTFVDESKMYNASPSDFGTMGAATTLDAEITLQGMGADSDPDNRASVNVRIKLRYPDTSDAYDMIECYFRETAVATWVSIDTDTQGGPTNWTIEPTAAAFRAFDVTAQASNDPSTGFEIGIHFFNGSSGATTMPSWDL